MHLKNLSQKQFDLQHLSGVISTSNFLLLSTWFFIMAAYHLCIVAVLLAVFFGAGAGKIPWVRQVLIQGLLAFLIMVMLLFFYKQELPIIIPIVGILEIFLIMGIYCHNLKLMVEKFSSEKKNRDALLVLLGVFCHDLSTPVMAIGLICFQKKNTPSISDAELQAWQEVYKLVEREKYLIDNIRKMERFFSEGQDSLELESVKIGEVLGQMQEIYGERLRAKEIKLIQRLEVASDTEFLSDRNILVFNILSNLFSNSIKFTPRQHNIYIGAKKNGRWMQIWIEDQGVGISPSQVQAILEGNPQRLSSLGTEEEKGTGLGLKIVMNFVEVLGGRFDVKSRCQSSHPGNHGTLFTLSFPLIVA